MNITTIFLLIAGLSLLVIGAEVLVRGASRLAEKAGITPLVVGLTVVSFGTSSPEIVVSVQAALNGQTELSVGNVVGSNIFNIFFILGLSAIITPLVVSKQLIKLDVPIMIGVSFLALFLGLDGNIGRLDGTLLFSGVFIYLFFLIQQSRKQVKSKNVQSKQKLSISQKKVHQSWIFNIILIIAGLILLVLGSNWLVEAAIVLATAMGVSNLIIGLTIIAAGTSLPEVATSVIASIRGERDIAVGNAVGSNIFNILGVLGLASLFAPSGLSISGAVLNLDFPVMLAVAVACLPIFFTGNVIARWEGILFLSYYFLYILYLILDSTQHQALPIFSMIMLVFVVPITIITLITVLLRSIQSQRRAKKRIK